MRLAQRIFNSYQGEKPQHSSPVSPQFDRTNQGRPTTYVDKTNPNVQREFLPKRVYNERRQDNLCFRCGSQEHMAGKCPLIQNDSVNTLNTNLDDNLVENDSYIYDDNIYSDNSKGESEIYINMIQLQGTKAINVKVKIGKRGPLLRGIVDTGADCNIMNSKLLKELEESKTIVFAARQADSSYINGLCRTTKENEITVYDSDNKGIVSSQHFAISEKTCHNVILGMPYASQSPL
jgi:hypothetical protein